MIDQDVYIPMIGLAAAAAAAYLFFQGFRRPTNISEKNFGNTGIHDSGMLGVGVESDDGSGSD